MAAASCVLLAPGLAVASESICGGDPKGTSSGDTELDAERKRLLETSAAYGVAAEEQRWRRVVQKLQENEEWWLKDCLENEKKGDLVKREQSYNSWKWYRDELDLYERDPRRWFNRHGQRRGLKMQMTPADKVANFIEDTWTNWTYVCGGVCGLLLYAQHMHSRSQIQ